MPSFTPPPGYTRVKVVKSFDELVTTPFVGGVNALCWERTLAGDFGEVVERLGVSEGNTTLDDARLDGLRLSVAGRAAVDILLEDQRLLRERGEVRLCGRDFALRRTRGENVSSFRAGAT